MKKFLLIAPRNAAREVPANSPDLNRYLNGSWVLVDELKPPTRNAQGVRRVRERQKARGYRAVHIPLSDEVFRKLHEAQLPGETLAKLIERLLSTASTEST